MDCEVPFDMKMEVVRTKKLCTHCLKRGHEVKDCGNERNCNHCGDKHHSAICAQHTPRTRKAVNLAQANAIQALATEMKNP